jgi:hypothetical protein
LNITNEIENPKWKNFFKHDANDIDCKHCKFKKAEDSIPREDFQQNTTNPETNEVTTKTITEITLDYDDNDCVRGWFWQ